MNLLANETFINIKSGLKSCLFINSPFQSIVCKDEKENKDYQYILVEDSFKISILKDEVKKAKEEFTNIDFIISPFLLLYNLFLKSKNDKALWVLNQKDFITFSVFKDSSAIYGKHIKKDKESFEDLIENAIRDFYRSECCYFLEEIFILDADNLYEDLIKYIEDKILLKTTIKKIDIKNEIENLCKDETLLKYAINIKKRGFSIPVWLKISLILIFLLLIIVDIYFRYKNSKLNSSLAQLQNEKVSIQKSIDRLTKEIKLLDSIVPIVQDIKSSNSLIKSNIKNIFDLIPDEIVLKKALFYKNSLILEGFTPTKREVYKLDRRLKSFYQNRDIKFTKIDNGYIFLSINRAKDEI